MGTSAIPMPLHSDIILLKESKEFRCPPSADQKILDELKEKIKSDPRVAISKKQMLQTILKQTQFKEFIPPGILYGIIRIVCCKIKSRLQIAVSLIRPFFFRFPDKKYTVGDWIVYRKSLKSSPNLTNGKTNTEILDLYRQIVAFEYYKEHLEKYNTAFAAQVNEFRDGNLLFEIMQRQIWNQAAADSAGLKKYFEAHTGRLLVETRRGSNYYLMQQICLLQKTGS